MEIAVTRAPIYVPAVELQIRIDAGNLVAEATGPWPILDFEKGKPVRLKAISGSEFHRRQRGPDTDHLRQGLKRESRQRSAECRTAGAKRPLGSQTSFLAETIGKQPESAPNSVD